MTQDYIVENKGDKDKTLIIEHPLKSDWKLVAPAKDAGEFTAEPCETTETLYRFKGSVPVGKASKLVVTEELVVGEALAILPADLTQLDLYSRCGAFPQKVKDALVKAMTLKIAMTDSQRQIGEKQQQAAAITQEQNRIRENMKTVEKTSQYYGRLMTKLNDQETLLEKFQNEIDGLHKDLDQQRKAMEDYLNAMSVE